MNELTYKQILTDFEAQEEGDFFRLYKLSIGSFIIYSPAKDKISCIECCNFMEITPEDLGVLLDKPIFMHSDIEDFSFEVQTNKEKILQYIFDIGFLDNNTGYYTHAIEPGEGYILDCISANKKIKSLNLINNTEGRPKLVFDNLLSYRDNGNTNAENLYVTFDSEKYNSLTTDPDLNSESFAILLASANNLLLNKVYEYNKKTFVVTGNENPLLVLKLYSFFLNKEEHNFISLDNDYAQLLVGFNKELFAVTDVMNLMNKCIEDIRNEFGSNICSFYDIKATGTFSYISFRNSRPLVSVFNRKFKEVFNAKLTVNTLI
ncbi:MAG: hypothetical protein ACK5M3_03190 [Dysgonomonas sp.]